MRKLVIVFFAMVAIMLFQHCNSSKKTTTPAVMAVSFEKDVLPIIQASCTPCHFPPDGRKLPFNNYDAVKNQIAEVIERVKLPQTDNKFMPFKNKKPALTDSAINVLVNWKSQGMAK
jgi:hypothetical protein